MVESCDPQCDFVQPGFIAWLELAFRSQDPQTCDLSLALVDEFLEDICLHQCVALRPLIGRPSFDFGFDICETIDAAASVAAASALLLQAGIGCSAISAIALLGQSICFDSFLVDLLLIQDIFEPGLASYIHTYIPYMFIHIYVCMYVCMCMYLRAWPCS